MATISEVRPSPIAGMWYEKDPFKLTLQIEDFLANAVIPELGGRVVALIVPHAGHRYSGRTAAYAYKAVMEKSYDLVIVASPMHAYYPAPLLTSMHSYYSTPLGNVEVDRGGLTQLVEIMNEDEPLRIKEIANDDEHSLEIQLPFLQRALSAPFQLLPIMVRRKDLKFTNRLGSALAKIAAGRSTLLVGSTDLSHFYNQQVAKTLDGEMLRQFEAFSPEGVLEAEESGRGFACGAPAVAAVLAAAREGGADHVRILHYSTSADETGDLNSVVGYGAAVVLQQD